VNSLDAATKSSARSSTNFVNVSSDTRALPLQCEKLPDCLLEIRSIREGKTARFLNNWSGWRDLNPRPPVPCPIRPPSLRARQSWHKSGGRHDTIVSRSSQQAIFGRARAAEQPMRATAD
jgi:hypothetical protein